MRNVTIYTKMGCPFCTHALQLLNEKKVDYEQIKIDFNVEKQEEMIEKTGGYTVPQIIIHGKPIGGCDDLYALEQAGKLDTLLTGD